MSQHPLCFWTNTPDSQPSQSLGQTRGLHSHRGEMATGSAAWTERPVHPEHKNNQIKEEEPDPGRFPSVETGRGSSRRLQLLFSALQVDLQASVLI